MPEPGGPGVSLVPPIFGRSVNPIPTGEGRLSPSITTGTPNVFPLPASLHWIPNTIRFLGRAFQNSLIGNFWKVV